MPIGQEKQRRIMIRAHVAAGAAAALGTLLLSSPALAEPQRAALIVGNANYASLPGIVGCSRSANAISAALRALNFQITERQDASTGGIDAGMSEFADRFSNGKGPGFVYICGYATDFNNRTFLLPTTARIGRPSDVITQGVLAKSMLTTVSRDPSGVAVVVFDLIPQPGPTQRIDLETLASVAVPDGVGIIAATEMSTSQAPTPLAAALVGALAGPDVRTEGVLAGVKAKLATTPATVVAWHVPAHPGFLAGGPPVSPSQPPPAGPVAAPVAPPVTVPAVATPAATAARLQLPDEAQMTELDRRQVQDSLLRLGYYDRAVDARFGPETRAAIRRYQHEIGGQMTGYLTSDQATRLVNSR
jgi:putative peptidoglycan binding protein/caspase domain-containing protein